jgi:hypothetical protein
MYKQLSIYIFYYTMMKNHLLCKCETCLTIYIEDLHKIIYELQEEKRKLVEQLQQREIDKSQTTQRPLSRM